MKFLPFVIFFFVLMSCDSQEKSNNSESGDKSEINMAPPAMNHEQIKELVQKTFLLEMFFHEYSFTSNIDGPQAGVRVGSMIDEAAPPGNIEHCKENILISILDKNMNELTTMRIKYSESCSVIDFHYNDEKTPRYRNKIASPGEQTFQSLIDQAEKFIEEQKNG